MQPTLGALSQSSYPVFWLGQPDAQWAIAREANVLSDVDQVPSPLVIQSTIAAVVVNQPADIQDDTLLRLHKRNDAWKLAIYTLQESQFSEALSNGQPPEEWLPQALKIKDRLSAIYTDQRGEPVDKVLAWLWLSPQRQLRAQANAQLPALYEYPLLSLWDPELQSQSRHLQQLAHEGLLTRKSLVDRIRCCPSCESGHLNYLETCPDCHSADITQQSALHCFTCGEVSDQERFQKSGGLVCPTCSTQLRHIGVDYDRPMEMYHCNRCSASFAEAETRARCLDCQSLHQVPQLHQRRYFHYGLNDRAIEMLRQGRMASYATTPVSGRVEATQLHTMLIWLNQMALQSPLPTSHLLVGIQLTQASAMLEQLGHEKSQALIDALVERLLALLRPADMCCHYKADLLFIVLPLAGQEALPSIQTRLNSLIQLREDNLLDLAVYHWFLPTEQMGLGAQKWLEKQIQVQIGE